MPQAAAVMAAVSDRIRTALGSVVVVSAVIGAPLVHAQAQVVDSSNRLIGSPASASAPASGPVTQTSTPQVYAAAPVQAQTAAGSQQELYYTVQALQEEVTTLRGLVEEQAYEIKQLKQQRLDDYLNLDRRLAELSGKSAASAAAPVSSDSASQSVAGGTASRAPAAASEPSGDEMQSYRAAIDLVLRQKNYEQAIVAFNQHLADFPQGTYAANSEYWLGEITLLQGDLEQSRSWFERLLRDYPAHDKAADAQYKLGTVYHKLGDVQKAKTLLNEVVSKNPNTNAARLAANYLSGI